MAFAGDTGCVSSRSVLIPMGSADRSPQLHPVPGLLKYDTGLTADWSFEEQSLLEEGLVKYGHEPNIMKYIKIAAGLQGKTRKENGKRCKQEKIYTWRKMKDKKDKQVDYSSGVNSFSSQLPSVASTSLIMYGPDSGGGMPHNVGDAAQYLLEENARILDRITHNLDDLKLQDNVDLLFHAKNNLVSILNRMSETRAMSQMARLPVSIDNKTFSALLLGVAMPQVVYNIPRFCWSLRLDAAGGRSTQERDFPWASKLGRSYP
ncbi:unnamed protein product [Spirodela intermedia]|uniref:Uncharacterized protein n=1 Tax=Spirodela intermedia TaxID=51605 RepID=A0A7I8JUX4_SPIIN|nr:unnamed protein product [Spirodela intermedia]CAA6673413.1 unnamed protein product [Spirodela intermedia]